MKKKMLKLNCEDLEFEEIEVDSNGLEIDFTEIQKALGGYFERVSFNTILEKENINMFVDDEGKLKDLKPSVAVCESVANKMSVVEVLAGSIVFTNRKHEYDYGLTDRQIQIIKEELKNIAVMVSGIIKDGEEKEIVESVRVLNYN